MKELPNPTFPLSLVSWPRGWLHRSHSHSHGSNQPAVPQIERGGLAVLWAKHIDEVRQAQRLRFRVFAEEMGARLDTTLPGHDVDLFDNYCEHLLVRDQLTREVVGTYLRLGAKVLGAPAWDPDFNTADLPMMMRINDLPTRYRKHFLGA